MVQCFAVFFFHSLFFWGITRNNHFTSTTKHRKFKRHMSGMKQLLLLLLFVVVVVVVDNSRSFLGHWAKNIALKRFPTKYVHSQSKCPPSIAYSAVSVLYVFCSCAKASQASVPQTNWKQCVWKSNINTDSWKIKVSKKYAK